MTRLIDAELLKSKISFVGFPHIDRNGRIDKSWVYELINSCPTVDTDLSKYSDKLWKAAYERGKSERPRGKWIRPSNASKRSYRRMCDQCHGISYFCGPVNYPYCPYCLADMRGEEGGRQ